MGKGKVDLNSHVRYRLTDDEEALLMKYRTQKSKLEDECNAAGIDPKEVKHYWYKSEMFSIFAKPKEKSLQDLKDHEEGETAVGEGEARFFVGEGLYCKHPLLP